MVKISILQQNKVLVSVNEEKTNVKATGTAIFQAGEAPPYYGPYEVTPQAKKSTVLPTAGRTMKKNVEVYPVPYWETSNDAGGTTVYIASGKEDM